MDSKWEIFLKKNGIDQISNLPKVIFEGCDGSGKTTIQENMMDVIRHTFMIHTSAPFKGCGKDYYYSLLKEMTRFTDLLEQPVFIDRFHIGELVYGSIFRPETIDEQIELKMFALEDELIKQNVKMVYVKANPKTIRTRLNNRGDWYIKESDIANILEKYETVLAKSKLPIYILNTTRGIGQEDIDKLVAFCYDVNKDIIKK